VHYRPLPHFRTALLQAACLLAAIAPSATAQAGELPPGFVPALSPEQVRLATALRRSRVERKLDPAIFAAEIAAGGIAQIDSCLTVLEIERIPPVQPGESPQVLSRPQREIVLAALGSLRREPVLAATFARLEAWPEQSTRVVTLGVLSVAGEAKHLDQLSKLALPVHAEQPTGAAEEAFREAMAGILKRDPHAFERLPALLRDAPEVLAGSIVIGVGDAGQRSGLPFLADVLRFRTDLGSLCADQIRRIGRSGKAEVDLELAQGMRWMLDPARPELCRTALLALGELHDYESIPGMIVLLSSSDRGLSSNALWALQRMTDLRIPAIADRWEAWYAKEQSWFQREEAATLKDLHTGTAAESSRAIRHLGERRIHRGELAVELIMALERPERHLRTQICGALSRLGADAAVPALVEMLEDADPVCAQAAWRALTQITGQELPASASQWRAALAMAP
jgi:hypothetical protein